MDRWEYCAHCRMEMVICGKCGNNCCNGGTGTLPDGSKCGCVSGYALQDARYNIPSSVGKG